MAIKIRKKGDGDEEGPEEEEQHETSSEVSPAESDPFLRGSAETISWFAENQNLVLGIVVALVVGGIGTYFGLQYMRQQQVRASDQLSKAIQTAEMPVEGSPVLQVYQRQDNIASPKETHDSNQKRWQDVYDAASETLDKHDTGGIGQGARLMKAAAALRLEKYEEAVSLYEAYLDGSPPEDNLPLVHYGMATAYGGAGQIDKAIGSYDKLMNASDKYETLAKYQKAILLQHAGETERARKLYEGILDNNPKSRYKQDIERRLALM
jgi:tetratricopeptide (TPR) repeat protein